MRIIFVDRLSLINLDQIGLAIPNENFCAHMAVRPQVLFWTYTSSNYFHQKNLSVRLDAVYFVYHRIQFVYATRSHLQFVYQEEKEDSYSLFTTTDPP